MDFVNNIIGEELKIFEELKNKEGIARDLGNIGSVYILQNDYSKALIYFSKALQMAEILKNKNEIARDLSSIGSIYFHNQDYPKDL